MNDKQPQFSVVEDQVFVRAMLQRMLDKSGISAELVASGEQALLRLEQGHSFQVLVVDLLMPGVHGIRLAGFAAMRQRRRISDRRRS